MHMKIAIISALLVVVAAAPPQPHSQYQQNSEPIPIVNFVQEQNPDDGSYAYKYETGNGIAVQAQASFPVQEDGPAPAVQGSYSYPGPDGVQYQLNYVADANGFQAQGAHLPTAPPMPDELVRAFAAAPQDEGLYDEKGFLIEKVAAVKAARSQ